MCVCDVCVCSVCFIGLKGKNTKRAHYILQSYTALERRVCVCKRAFKLMNIILSRDIIPYKH